MSSRGAFPPSIAASEQPPQWRELPPLNRRRLLSLSRLLEHRFEQPATTPQREVNDHDRG